MSRTITLLLMLATLPGAAPALLAAPAPSSDTTRPSPTEEPPSPEEFWTRDMRLDEALAASDAASLAAQIDDRLAAGAARLRLADGSLDLAAAEALVQAMRWASIRHQQSALPRLDEIAATPRGRTNRQIHDGLTYTARWAAWRMRTAELTPQAKIAGLIADWRQQGAASSFAEHRLLELPGASGPLIAMAVDELLPAAGHFEEGELVVEDLDSADLLSRAMTLIEVRAENHESELAAIRQALTGTALEFWDPGPDGADE